MTIRFAAAVPASVHPLVKPFLRGSLGNPANDNGAGVAPDAMVIEALRHFAEHGLAAARHARSKARAAHAARDDAGYAYWLKVCRQLDRRMAATLERTLEAELAGAG